MSYGVHQYPGSKKISKQRRHSTQDRHFSSLMLQLASCIAKLAGIVAGFLLLGFVLVALEVFCRVLMRVPWEGLLGSMVVVPLVLAVGGVVVVGVVLQALNAVTGECAFWGLEG